MLPLPRLVCQDLHSNIHTGGKHVVYLPCHMTVDYSAVGTANVSGLFTLSHDH